MFMQKRSKAKKGRIPGRIVQAFIIVLGLMTMVGSGGGGDGGGGGGSPTGLTYTGLIDPAPIDATNSQLLLGGIVSGVDLASNLGGFFGAVQDSGAGANYVNLLEVTRLLENAMLQIDFNAGATGINQGVVQNETIPGSCGGTFTYNITVDDFTGAFSGTLSFNAYCEEGMTISGSIAFSGAINLGTSELSNFVFDFSWLTVNGGGEAAVLDGTMSIDVVNGIITMNLLIKENTTVYKYENTVLTESLGATTIEGRYYHPDYGYVDITTTTPFTIYGTDEFPSNGILLIVGANNTKARLTAIDNVSCRVEADTNGNDVWGEVVDYDSGIIAWTAL
jgi:hypothetical protein